MKPAFALSFSTTGISLYHHSDDDWFSIGAVALDAPDLTEQMQALRDKGFALENDLSCKVMIPADQIRYLSISTESLSREESAQKVHDALVESVPYDISELSFDTTTRGPTTYVAAVARQTLTEARAFATEHGFIPTLFSADSSEEEFPQEPHFDLNAEITAAATPVPPTVVDEPPTVEDAPSSTPAVHAIAETAALDTFRSPEPLDKLSIAGNVASRTDAKRFALPVIAAAILVTVIVGVWSLLGPRTDSDLTEVETATPQSQPAPQAITESTVENTQIAAVPQSQNAELEAEEQPELTPTDAAILEALKVPPTPVEQVEVDPTAQLEAETVAGLSLTPPTPPVAPAPVELGDLYLASIDKSGLSNDAIALPPVSSFATDLPFDQVALPNAAGTRFDLDERGLVTPTQDGTLNPDGVMVHLGRPSSVPPEVPVRFEDEPVVEEADQRLAQRRPRPRPGDLVEQFEREQLGGRSLEELAVLRPKLRPESLQARPKVDETPTALAVVRVPRPKSRPAGIAAKASRAASSGSSNLGSTAAVDQTTESGSFQPKTVAPKIPSTASVARQATIDNAINLRRLNLIGVYGTPANRRALVRLPSGRYKKLKIGDRIDGGRVIAISDSELRYQKKGRNLTLKMPRG
ncbi:hypothetical protein HW561_03775 [Rhodobacteraceae bacterium B1Z28]|uniref:Type IV pilus biogenesis protein PilP n=1 Tax=Ruegeria haliotis TaxID=2747601 RepID=A0ABX2PN89_9RHOB|nr:hypothetical protein [Ruegeria haliotis]NVO54906.1 hypothetical protein [Ruegeria haliotis]